MSNGLSQAEIDALLRGEPVPGVEPSPPEDEIQPGNALPSSEIAKAFTEAQDEEGADEEDLIEPMTPSEAKAAFAAAGLEEDGEAQERKPDGFPDVKPDTSGVLTPIEVDAMGEIGNISMGTSATTLFALLNRRVDITTPKVSVATMAEIARTYPLPFVAVEVKYTIGLEGTNVLFLKQSDVKIITDLMLGGDGTNVSGELTEMHMSCISEVMNQMMGSASTSLAKMLNKSIDISPPTAYQVNLAEPKTYPFSEMDDIVVRTGFDMEVEGLIKSEIMQITPVPFAKEMVRTLMNINAEPAAPAAPAPQATAPAPQAPQTPPPAAPQAAPQAAPVQAQREYEPQAAQSHQSPPSPMRQQAVDVRPMQYASFEGNPVGETVGENMDLLLDVPLQVSVELGKSRKYIKEILDFNVGTIIVLDKMAGELVDVVVNGKLIAKGEVVVIDESFGCRITDIISPSKRIVADSK